MNLPKKLTSIRLIATLSCLLAVGAFLPPQVYASEEMELEGGGYCMYAGLQYSLGAIRDGQTCKKDASGEYYWA